MTIAHLDLQFPLPPTLDLLLNLLLSHSPQILPQNLPRRTLWNSLYQNNSSSQFLMIGNFGRYPFRYVLFKFFCCFWIFQRCKT